MFDVKKLSPAPEAVIDNSECNSVFEDGYEPNDCAARTSGEHLIAKPKGTYGHPDSGGYSIKHTVMKHNISEDEFDDLKVIMRQFHKNMS